MFEGPSMSGAGIVGQGYWGALTHDFTGLHGSFTVFMRRYSSDG